MCQMCEEYEAELRRMGIPPHQLELSLDDELAAALTDRAARSGHTVKREIELILREHCRPGSVSVDVDAAAPGSSAI